MKSTQKIAASLKNDCPQCHTRGVFRWFKMRKKCASCGYLFLREPGYFMGALVFTYLIGCASLVPAVIIGVFVYDLSALTLVIVGAAQILMLAPFTYRYSRLIWIHLDYHADPERHVH